MGSVKVDFFHSMLNKTNLETGFQTVQFHVQWTVQVYQIENGMLRLASPTRQQGFTWNLKSQRKYAPKIQNVSIEVLYEPS